MPTTLPAGTPWYDYPIWPNAFGQNGETGIDLRTPVGTPITSLFAGTVESASHQAWGWQVVVDVPTKAGQFIREVLVHLDSVAVRSGQRVQAGTVLGLSGGEPPITSSKYSAGPHTELDFFTGPVWQHTNPQTGAQEFVDPTPLIRALGNPALAGGQTQGQNSHPVGTPLSFDPCAWLPDGPLKDACYANTFGGAGTTPGVGQPNGPNPLGGIEGLMALLTNPSTWLRVGGALLGVLLIIVAVAAMLRKE